MWCERVIRNLDDSDQAGEPAASVDWVDLQWNECRRLLKTRTRSGVEVRVLLPVGELLRHHDVLYEHDTRIVAVQVIPCELIAAFPASSSELALLSLELGNLHLAVEVRETALLFCENEQAMEVLESMGIQWTREVRRFAPQTLISTPTVQVSADLRVILRSTGNGSLQTSALATPRN